jgi:glycerol-3-phosphate dehydrogenase
VRPSGRRADGRRAGLGRAATDREVDHWLRRVEAERQSQLQETDQEADEARVKAPEIV